MCWHDRHLIIILCDYGWHISHKLYHARHGRSFVIGMGIFFGTAQKFFSQSIEFYPNVKLYQSCIVSLSYYHISDIHEASSRFEESGDQRASGATPDLLDNQYDDEYATMKFKSGPISQRPRAQTASLYLDSSQTPMLDQLHKND